MNINNINFNNVRFNSLSKLNSTPLKSETNKLERTPQADSVSFCGNKKDKKAKQRICTSVELYEKLMDNMNKGKVSIDDISEIIGAYSKNVVIRPISELQEITDNPDDYVAFLYTEMAEDEIRPTVKTMYIDIPQDFNDEDRKLIFASNCAHEFTHLQQIDTLDEYKVLEEMSMGNIEYSKLIRSFGECLFSSFDTEIQQNAVSLAFSDEQDIQYFKKYHSIYPREENISKDIIAKGLGLKSESQINRFLNGSFDENFESIWIANAEHINYDDYLPKGESKKDFKEKIKRFCVICATKEKEAYTTEAEIGRKALKTGRSLNIDALPLYYTMLEDALK